MLAEGTREVAAGNLNYKVQVRADDEIGILGGLVQPDDRRSRRVQSKLEATYYDLQAKHDEMERRRRYTETVLEAVATGVVSLDPAGRVTTINGAAERMLGAHRRPGPRVAGDARCSARPEYAEIAALVTSAWRGCARGRVEREVHLRRDGQAIALLASATALKGPDGADMGMVLAFDDLTELLKAQRLAAWREVAQRIAHEIKNPLTPIQLSAQRLAAAARRRRQPRGEAPARGGHRHHHPGGGRAQAARGRVLALRPDARAVAAPDRPRRGCSTGVVRALPRVASRAEPSSPPSRRTCPRRGGPEPDQARGAQPGGQRGGGGGRQPARWWCRRSGCPTSRRARIAVADDRARHRAARTRSASSCPTSPPRPPAWDSGCPSSTRS